MFPIWSTIVFAIAGIVGLFLLIKSISKIIAVYNNPNNVEFSATLGSNTFEIKQAGEYEIAVKRPYLFGVIPSKISFHLVKVDDNSEIPVRQSVNLFSQRKDMSGNRIVPIAEFNIEQIGKYQLDNSNLEQFREKDKFLIAPKTGFKGFLLIFAILFSAILFIGGLVMTALSLVKK